VVVINGGDTAMDCVRSTVRTAAAIDRYLREKKSAAA